MIACLDYAVALHTAPTEMSVGNLSSRKNSVSHIDASHSRQPLVKGERLVRYEVNAVMIADGTARHIPRFGTANGLFVSWSSAGGVTHV